MEQPDDAMQPTSHHVRYESTLRNKPAAPSFSFSKAPALGPAGTGEADMPGPGAYAWRVHVPAHACMREFSRTLWVRWS